jgi:hypothetical protein
MSHHPDEITITARAMTHVEPPAGLESRIKNRLDAVARPSHTRWRPAYWIGAAGLTATAALLALVVQGPSRSTVRGSSELRGATGPEVQASPSISSSPQLPISPSHHLPTSSPVRLPAYRTMSASEADWMSRRVEALDLIDPIQPERVSITPLTMTPLMTSPVFGVPDEWQQ